MRGNLKYFWLTDKGVTLIELMIALVMSSILIAALYRVFISQQQTYTVQEQVTDMQQNARAGINRMMGEIRMAGFGNVSGVLPLSAIDGPFNDIINPNDNKNNVGQNDDQITIIGAFEQVSTLAAEAPMGTNKIRLKGYGSEFDKNNKKYICIGGLETQILDPLIVDNPSGNEITISGNLLNNYDVGIPVFKVKAITFKLRWDTKDPTVRVLAREDNTDGGGKSYVLGENIENLQFRYTLVDGSETDLPANPANVRMVRATVTAATAISDDEYKNRKLIPPKRTIASNIYLRNMGLSP